MPTSADAKVAAMYLSKMAVELAEHGITANSVSLGPVDTPMTRVLHSDQFRKEYTHAIPMDRYGSTAEVAMAEMYFVSDEAGYTMGGDLALDGGFLAAGAHKLN